jgi:hypothetical protein
VVIILIVLLVGTILLFKSKPSGFIPTEDEGRIYITYDLPEASSTERTVAVLHQMMRYAWTVRLRLALCCPGWTERSEFCHQIKQRYHICSA